MDGDVPNVTASSQSKRCSTVCVYKSESDIRKPGIWIRGSLQPEVCFMMKIVNKEVGVSKYRKQESGPNLNRKYNPRRNSKKNQEATNNGKSISTKFSEIQTLYSTVVSKEKKRKENQVQEDGLCGHCAKSDVEYCKLCLRGHAPTSTDRFIRHIIFESLAQKTIINIVMSRFRCLNSFVVRIRVPKVTSSLSSIRTDNQTLQGRILRSTCCCGL